MPEEGGVVVRSRVVHDERLESDVIAGCKKLVRDFGGYLEVIGQRKAKGSGTTVGFPDAVYYRRGKAYLIEFKRPHGGVLRRDQELAIECRKAEGVPTYVVSNEQEFADLMGGRLKPA